MKKCKSRPSRCFALETALSIFESIDTPVSLACWLMLKHDPAGLIEHTIDPLWYKDARTYHDDYIAVCLLSKWQHFDIGIDRSKVALEKFLLSEERCREANIRLAAFNRTVFSMTDRLPSIIQVAKAKIERCLGKFSWDESLRYMGFGPGASIDVPRSKGDSLYKFGLTRPSVTSNCAGLSNALMEYCELWKRSLSGLSGSDSLHEIVQGNRITTVPKSAKTDRVIAIEPTMNMFIQKGIGGMIRRRLRSVDINLNDQGRNQELAKKASFSDKLATLDLSSASDSVAMSCVELLLPEDWTEAIKLCRSRFGTLPDGRMLFYQKVSSMGNGFTFELESLVFWALVESVIQLDGGDRRDCSIYGDDIICPSKNAAEVQSVLEYFGFSLNESKSFVSGPFRESCGKHYFLGHDVSPLYIKDHVDSPERLFWLANSISRLAHVHLGAGYGRSGQFRYSHRLVVGKLPRKLQRPMIPYNLGDQAICGDFDEVKPRRLKHSLDGYSCTGFVRIYRHVAGEGTGQLLKSLFRLGGLSVRRVEPAQETPSGSDRKDLTMVPVQAYVLKFVKLETQQWAGLGPWI